MASSRQWTHQGSQAALRQYKCGSIRRSARTMEMNWMLVCCCLYLYSRKKSEENNLLEENGTKHRHFRSLRTGMVWTRGKKLLASNNHDQLHQTLGKEVNEPRPRHIYAQPLPTPGSVSGGRSQSPEPTSLVKKLGRKLYKTFEKNKAKKEYQETVAPQKCEQGLESPFDSFEVTESFEVEETYVSTPVVTGSITNRNPRAASQYQNMPHSCLSAQSEHRYTENWRQSRPSIPPPPPRCYLNQAYADRGGRALYGGVDNRRQIRSYQ